MCPRQPIPGMRSVVWKCFVGMMERVRLRGPVGETHAGLVHVIPKSGDTLVDVTFELRTEPIARFRIRKIRKRRRLWPDIAVELGTIRLLQKNTEPFSFGVVVILRI